MKNLDDMKPRVDAYFYQIEAKLQSQIVTPPGSIRFPDKDSFIDLRDCPSPAGSGWFPSGTSLASTVQTVQTGRKEGDVASMNNFDDDNDNDEAPMEWTSVWVPFSEMFKTTTMF